MNLIVTFVRSCFITISAKKSGRNGVPKWKNIFYYRTQVPSKLLLFHHLCWLLFLFPWKWTTTEYLIWDRQPSSELLWSQIQYRKYLFHLRNLKNEISWINYFGKYFSKWRRRVLEIITLIVYKFSCRWKSSSKIVWN